ncbi:Spo0B domain-containing protein [Halobacillus sp. A5]|uniref:Spo0B domain-containing protein n=1 Tax=Halobacillus sp. A5 TaxID=2880263 RepID=UPI0020A66209|nr:sporulation initiation phosphotransferase B [Halobacillus sp. A5]
MESHEVLHILRHKRHDWMNQIQLVHGYASMGKMDRVKEHLYQIIEHSEQERRLLNSGADHFSLWLLTFNWNHSHYQLSYLIEKDVDLSSHDDQLISYAGRVLTKMDEHRVSDELYEGILQVFNEDKYVMLNWTWAGEFMNSENLANHLRGMGITVSAPQPHEITLKWKIE